MERTKHSSEWLDEGYKLFAHEGLEGIQIERLARIMGLNKSGFYHYFGDLEGYCAALGKRHEANVNAFLQDIGQARQFDPDYLLLLIKHSVTVMFQMQALRSKASHDLHKVASSMNDVVEGAVRNLWCDFLGIGNSSDLAKRYYVIVRDMYHTRINFANLNYEFLHELATEAKQLMDKITDQLSDKNALDPHL